jgi:hypothetical protein
LILVSGWYFCDASIDLVCDDQWSKIHRIESLIMQYWGITAFVAELLSDVLIMIGMIYYLGKDAHFAGYVIRPLGSAELADGM